MANVRIIYSAATSQPRRVVVADSVDDHLPGTGEANIDLSMDDYVAIGSMPAALSAYVASTTGQPLLPSLYAVVDVNNNVTANIVCDPLCGDAVPNCTLNAVTSPQQVGQPYVAED